MSSRVLGVHHPSTTSLIIGVALDIVCAVVGYGLSESDRRAQGRTPWGLPSGLWALFWFFFPVGTVLYVIAHITGVRQAHKGRPITGTPIGGSPPSPMARPRGPTASELFPAYPRPANSQPRSDPEPEQVAGPPAAGPAVQPDPASSTHTPPAWHPDPSGRFHYRWWDGTQWTSQVSTDGHHLIDTNPDQRIGPY
jgi:hypothetical protein